MAGDMAIAGRVPVFRSPQGSSTVGNGVIPDKPVRCASSASSRRCRIIQEDLRFRTLLAISANGRILRAGVAVGPFCTMSKTPTFTTYKGDYLQAQRPLLIAARLLRPKCRPAFPNRSRMARSWGTVRNGTRRRSPLCRMQSPNLSVFIGQRKVAGRGRRVLRASFPLGLRKKMESDPATPRPKTPRAQSSCTNIPGRGCRCRSALVGIPMIDINAHPQLDLHDIRGD